MTYRDFGKDNTLVSFSNICLTAFISWTPLRLYKLIENVGYDKVLYVDTDLIMFMQNKNKQSPLYVGNYLNQLTDEFDPDWEIIMFIELGPKIYAYRKSVVSTEKVEDVKKIRGITLKYRVRKEINFGRFYDLVIGIKENIFFSKS